MALPAYDPWAPPVLRLLQPFVLPQSFCPPGLQRAPCGCCFDPRVFHVQWTIPYNHQGTAAAPVLPTPIHGYLHLEGQFARLNISSQASAAGTPPGSRVPPCSAAPHNKAAGDPPGHLAVPEKVLLEDALRLFGCSVDTEGVSKGDPSTIPKPAEPGDTVAAAPPRDFSSLALPEELLTPDYSVPEARAAVLSMKEFYILGMEPPELWDAAMELRDAGRGPWDAGRRPWVSQATPAEQRGLKRGHKPGQSPWAEPPSKRRGWVGGGD